MSTGTFEDFFRTTRKSYHQISQLVRDPVFLDLDEDIVLLAAALEQVPGRSNSTACTPVIATYIHVRQQLDDVRLLLLRLDAMDTSVQCLTHGRRSMVEKQLELRK